MTMVRILVLIAAVCIHVVAAETVTVQPWNPETTPSATATTSPTLTARQIIDHPDVVWIAIDPATLDVLPKDASRAYVIGLRKEGETLPRMARIVFKQGETWYATKPVDELLAPTSTNKAAAAQQAAALTTAAVAAGL